MGVKVFLETWAFGVLIQCSSVDHVINGSCDYIDQV